MIFHIFLIIFLAPKMDSFCPNRRIFRINECIQRMNNIKAYKHIIKKNIPEIHRPSLVLTLRISVDAFL